MTGWVTSSYMYQSSIRSVRRETGGCREGEDGRVKWRRIQLLLSLVFQLSGALDVGTGLYFYFFFSFLPFCRDGGSYSAAAVIFYLKEEKKRKERTVWKNEPKLALFAVLRYILGTKLIGS